MQAAACAGWGKMYITSDSQRDETDGGNPWNEITKFWDDLVDVVSFYGTLPPTNCPDPRMTLMVPLWTALANGEAGALRGSPVCFCVAGLAPRVCG